MIKKSYIVVAFAVVSVLLGSLLYNNLVLAGKPVPETQRIEITNFPLDEEGNLKTAHAQTTRKIAIRVIDPMWHSSLTYFKIGEITVPANETWYLYKLTFVFDGGIEYLQARLVIAGDVMMNDVGAVYVPLTTGPRINFFHELELRRCVELFEGEKIELWSKLTEGTTPAKIGLTIEAWVEEI